MIIEDKTTKTLGLFWNATTDSFHCNLERNKLQTKVTKRIVLSTIAKIFDPLDLIGAVTTKAKIIL